MMTVVRQLQALFVNTTLRTPQTTNTHTYMHIHTLKCTLTHISIKLTFRKKNTNTNRTREHGTEPNSSKTTSDRILHESE